MKQSHEALWASSLCSDWLNLLFIFQKIKNAGSIIILQAEENTLATLRIYSVASVLPKKW